MKHADGVGARLTGKVSLFRNKIRAPVSITLTADHHAKVNAAMIRLRLSRSDLFGLLVEKYADQLSR